MGKKWKLRKVWQILLGLMAVLCRLDSPLKLLQNLQSRLTSFNCLDIEKLEPEC